MGNETLSVFISLEEKSSLLPPAFLRCHILKESKTEKEQIYSQSLEDDELFILWKLPLSLRERKSYY